MLHRAVGALPRRCGGADRRMMLGGACASEYRYRQLEKFFMRQRKLFRERRSPGAARSGGWNHRLHRAIIRAPQYADSQ